MAARSRLLQYRRWSGGGLAALLAQMSGVRILVARSLRQKELDREGGIQ